MIALLFLGLSLSEAAERNASNGNSTDLASFESHLRRHLLSEMTSFIPEEHGMYIDKDDVSNRRKGGDVKPIFSTYRCIGGHEERSELGVRGNQRHCVFHNVCHKNGDGDMITYFADANDVGLPTDYVGSDVRYKFLREQWVQLGAYEGFTPLYSPRVNRTTYGLPPIETYPYAPLDRYILYHPFVEHNPGHFIDTLFVIYSLPVLLGYEPHLNIQLLDANFDKMEKVRSQKHRNALLPGVTAVPPRAMKDVGNVCFKNLFVGSGRINVLQGDWVAPFTATKMIWYMIKNIENYHVKHGAPLRFLTHEYHPRRHRIVILEKVLKVAENDANFFKEHDILVKVIKEYFEDTGIAEVVNLRGSELSWMDQLKEIRKATCILSAPGGTSFLASFARPGTAVVISDKNYNGLSNRDLAPAGKDNNWFSSLSHIFLFHYQVCTQDESIGGSIRVVFPRMYMMLLQALSKVERQTVVWNSIEKGKRVSYLYKKAYEKPANHVKMEPISQSCRFGDEMPVQVLDARKVGSITSMTHNSTTGERIPIPEGVKDADPPLPYYNS